MVGLNEAWYKNQPRSAFHLFNDWNEWHNMDKWGHWYSAFSLSRLTYNGARWTGIRNDKAILLGTGLGFFLQGSIEILDGFSEKWGFSLSDMAFNTLGCATFFLQQQYWGEQRIVAKVSSTPKSYPKDALISTNGVEAYSLDSRAKDLFGASLIESFLKDYNAQTVWASVNVGSFLQQSRWPAWLNLAVGYSAENLYAGYGYNFSDPQGRSYNLNPGIYPRYGQIFFGPDIDFTKIPTRSGFLKLVFQALNIFKFPSPIVEYNRIEGFKLHVLYW